MASGYDITIKTLPTSHDRKSNNAMDSAVDAIIVLMYFVFCSCYSVIPAVNT